MLKPTALRKNAVLFLILLLCACEPPRPEKEIPRFLLKFPKGSFAYPVSDSEYVTERNDWSDGWYNAQDFGENRHLGEDWNASSGGDSDCGEPVYAAADGIIVYSADAGPGWGNVIMVEHTGEDGTKIRTLYGHLDSIIRTEGTVGRREQIGTIGNANGRYKCHLHFEIRWSECSVWNEAGAGYSDQRHGWIDPSEFIERTR